MAKRLPITAAQLRQILDYDPNTGEFRWRERTPDMFVDSTRVRAGKEAFQSKEQTCSAWNSRRSGKKAGSLGKNCRIYIKVEENLCLAHRLAWLYFYGEDPFPHEIDHVNLLSYDNRIQNLRLANRSQNAANVNARNALGVKGVYYDARRRKYTAKLGKLHLGTFATAEDAHAAFKDAHKAKWRDFSRT